MPPPLQRWLLAARPKTLAAALVPVLIGGALAHANSSFQLLPWLLCLGFATGIQVGTNFANDYADAGRGADGPRRIGPARAVASGWINAATMRRATAIVFTLSFAIGLGLVPFGGPWLIAVGLASVLCGYAYTAGPYPLGYNGWGDVFVFVFFGLVATGFTFYVQSGSFAFAGAPAADVIVWLAGSVPGALATNLLVVNNYRDAPQDAAVGKRTLAVRFGRRFASGQFLFLNALAIAVPVAFALLLGWYFCTAALLAVPLMLDAQRRLVRAVTAAEFKLVLTRSATGLLLCGGLFALGIALG